MPVTISPILRKALAADAAVSGAAAALMLVGTGILGPLLDLPAGLLQAAGAVLVPYVLLLALWSRRPALPRAVILGVVTANALWVLGSILLLVAGPVSPNALGIAFVIAQAVAVAAFAEFQVIGLRRSAAAA